METSVQVEHDDEEPVVPTSAAVIADATPAAAVTRPAVIAPEPKPTEQPLVSPMRNTAATAATHPVIFQIVEERTGCCGGTYDDYKIKEASICAGLQLALGALSVTMNSSALDAGASHHYIAISHGIWSPLFWFLAGGIGLASTCSKTKCTIITTLIFSAISASTIAYYLPLTCAGLRYEAEHKYEYGYNYDNPCDVMYDDYGNSWENCTNGESIPRTVADDWYSRIVFESLMLITCLAEGIVSILAAVLCGQALVLGSANKKQQTQNVLRYMPMHMGDQGGVLMPDSSSFNYQSRDPYAVQRGAHEQNRMFQHFPMGQSPQMYNNGGYSMPMNPTYAAEPMQYNRAISPQHNPAM